tara:strand:+ start:2227 stop:2595 length:369 start_codon:yes stop_codon:yes gene_type:complete
VRLNEIYNTYKDQVEFLSIYIREAHPDDGWRTAKNVREGIRYIEPRTDDERTEIATVCQQMMDLQMPMLIDSIDNDAESKYISIPMRLYLVDAAGNLAYVGGEGPFDFKPDEFEAAIKEAAS